MRLSCEQETNTNIVLICNDFFSSYHGKNTKKMKGNLSLQVAGGSQQAVDVVGRTVSQGEG